MANRRDKIRERNIATCTLSLLLEKRGRLQLEKSLRRLEFDSNSAWGKHVRRIQRLEKEFTESISSNVVSSIARYYESENDSPVGTDGEKSATEPSSKSSHKPSDNASQKRASICAGKQCLQFPCRRERTYHFMFETSHSMKETREFLWRQQTTFSARKNESVEIQEEDAESRSSSPISYKGSMELDTDTVLQNNTDGMDFSNNKSNNVLPDLKTNICGLTKKEIFLKSTVQSKKNAVPRKIDFSVRYGKPLPWRILLRPVRPTKREPLQTSGKKILAF